MIRDSIVAALLYHQFSEGSAVKRAAAMVLVRLCREGMSDAEIAATLENAAPLMKADLLQEIRSIAARFGIALEQSETP